MPDRRPLTAEIPEDILRLCAVRNAVARSGEFTDVTVADMPGEGPDGRFRLTLTDGTTIRVDLTIIGRKP